jgi:hypothetical protein
MAKSHSKTQTLEMHDREIPILLQLAMLRVLLKSKLAGDDEWKLEPKQSPFLGNGPATATPRRRACISPLSLITMCARRRRREASVAEHERLESATTMFSGGGYATGRALVAGRLH